jgi:alpha-1,2-rhamnosyltransferase
LADYLVRVSDAGGPPRQVSPFYLGSELDFVNPDQRPSEAVLAVFDVPEHVFIVVGSIEPRKNHGYIVDAFEQYWATGGTARLVVIGRHGWRNEAVMARMARHEFASERLFLMRDMTDSELDYAYRNASALVIASQAEGFGLPVVEAFQRGLPVLCSDIPVFREIAEGRAVFFSLSDPASLADAVVAFCAGHDVAARGMRDEQPWLTWRESTEQLMDIVLGSPV